MFTKLKKIQAKREPEERLPMLKEYQVCLKVMLYQRERQKLLLRSLMINARKRYMLVLKLNSLSKRLLIARSTKEASRKIKNNN